MANENTSNYMSEEGALWTVDGTLTIGSAGTFKKGSTTLPLTTAANIAAISLTYTTGTSVTPNGAVTIADAAVPTVAELLEFCVELNAKVNALRLAGEGFGIAATA